MSPPTRERAPWGGARSDFDHTDAGHDQEAAVVGERTAPTGVRADGLPLAHVRRALNAESRRWVMFFTWPRRLQCTCCACTGAGDCDDEADYALARWLHEQVAV